MTLMVPWYGGLYFQPIFILRADAAFVFIMMSSSSSPTLSFTSSSLTDQVHRSVTSIYQMPSAVVRRVADVGTSPSSELSYVVLHGRKDHSSDARYINFQLVTLLRSEISHPAVILTRVHRAPRYFADRVCA